MVAGAHERGKDGGDGGRSGPERDGVRPAFEGGDGLLQGERRRRPMPAVTGLGRVLPLLRLVEGLDGREQDGRGVIDGRVVDAVGRLRIAAGGGGQLLWAWLFYSAIVLR